MVCGRLARRIAWVMLWKCMVTTDTLFTLPKPLVHLLCYIVNIVLEGGGCKKRRDKLTEI